MPVVLCLLGAGLCLFFGHNARVQRVVSMVTLSAVVVIAAILLVAADRNGPQVVNIGGWPSRLGIVLVADRLSALLLLVSAVVALCVLVYSIGQGIIEFGADTPLSVFYPTFLVLSAGVSNAFLSGDLFNLYVGFEVLLAASYVLITIGGTGPRVRAGTTYVVVAVLSSMVFLIGDRGHLRGHRHGQPGRPGGAARGRARRGQVGAAAVAVDGVRDQGGGLPALGLVAGLLSDRARTGHRGVRRAAHQGRRLRDHPDADPPFPGRPSQHSAAWAAMLTMLVGILGAIAQSDIKRMLSFTLVSHIGFMVFGIALATELALASAIFYTVHHITIQTTLFLVTGLIEIRGGSTSVTKLGGLARAAPILALLFFIPAMNLAGIPPFSGFFGKVGLAEAGIAQGGWLAMAVVAASMVTSLLTLWAVAKTWNGAFWKPAQPADETAAEQDERGEDPVDPAGTKSGEPWSSDHSGTAVRSLPRAMVAPTAALVALGVGLAVFAGPLFGITSRAAVELQERQTYIEAVLDDGSGVGR